MPAPFEPPSAIILNGATTAFGTATAIAPA
jgi:hypothetical protein